MVYMKDIAAEVGVSVSLVSKVLNGKMGTSLAREEIVRAIHRVAREMGYRKNQSAAALRRRKHNAIGVMIHRDLGSSDGWLQGFLEGVSEVSIERGQRQMLGFFATGSEFRSLLSSLHEGMIDGLIVAGDGDESQGVLLAGPAGTGLPVVTVCDAPWPSLPCANVGPDPTVGRADPYRRGWEAVRRLMDPVGGADERPSRAARGVSRKRASASGRRTGGRSMRRMVSVPGRAS